MKKKIIIIGVALALALALVGGGVAYAFNGATSGWHQLVGTGLVGYERDVMMLQDSWWDTEFIVTNPNCDTPLEIDVIYYIIYYDVGDDGIVTSTEQAALASVLIGPHEVWKFSMAEILGVAIGEPVPLMKCSLEFHWRGATYNAFYGWGYDRPLIGWAKEKCYYYTGEYAQPGMSISETEMINYPVPSFSWWVR